MFLLTIIFEEGAKFKVLATKVMDWSRSPSGSSDVVLEEPKKGRWTLPRSVRSGLKRGSGPKREQLALTTWCEDQLGLDPLGLGAHPDIDWAHEGFKMHSVKTKLSIKGLLIHWSLRPHAKVIADGSWVDVANPEQYGKPCHGDSIL